MPPLHLAGTLSPWRGNATSEEGLLGENGKERGGKVRSKPLGVGGQSFSKLELPAAPRLL